MKSPKYFCEHCGREVKGNAKVCPHCGRFFSSVKCPRCGYSGRPEDFTGGCPVCGYGLGKPAPGEGDAHAGRRAPTDPLPAWVYLIALFALVIAVMLLFVYL